MPGISPTSPKPLKTPPRVPGTKTSRQFRARLDARKCAPAKASVVWYPTSPTPASNKFLISRFSNKFSKREQSSPGVICVRLLVNRGPGGFCSGTLPNDSAATSHCRRWGCGFRFQRFRPPRVSSSKGPRTANRAWNPSPAMKTAAKQPPAKQPQTETVFFDPLLVSASAHRRRSPRPCSVLVSSKTWSRGWSLRHIWRKGRIGVRKRRTTVDKPRRATCGVLGRQKTQRKIQPRI